jgi:hypothetical protein
MGAGLGSFAVCILDEVDDGPVIVVDAEKK